MNKLILLLLIYPAIMFSQKYSDEIYLKNNRVINANIISIEFRALKIESEEAEFILVSRIDSIKTNKKGIVDSLKNKYKSSTYISVNNGYILNLSSIILEERVYPIPLFKRNSLSLFFSTAYFSRFGVQYTVSPSFISELIICKIEYGVGSDEKNYAYDNSNFVIGIGAFHQPTGLLELGILLNYGICNFTDIDNWQDYTSLSAFGRYFVVESKSLFLQVELNYFINGAGFQNDRIHNDIRIGLGALL